MVTRRATTQGTRYILLRALEPASDGEEEKEKESAATPPVSSPAPPLAFIASLSSSLEQIFDWMDKVKQHGKQL